MQTGSFELGYFSLQSGEILQDAYLSFETRGDSLVLEPRERLNCLPSAWDAAHPRNPRPR